MIDLCITMKGLLAQIGSPGTSSVPPLLLCAHATACKRCRIALSQYAALTSGQAPPIQPCSCEKCQDDLPAFIDLEADYGAVQAIREQPQLWLHLCTCSDCAETYHLTRLLLEQSDLAVHLAAVAPPPTPPGPFCIAGSMLTSLFGPQPPALTWGSDDNAQVLLEEVQAGQRTILTVTCCSDDRWEISVSLTPPRAGQALLRLGAHTLTASLDPDGHAYLGALPGDILASGDDLVLSFELEG